VDPEKFDLFLSLDAQGRRKEAGAAIAAFAASFRDLAEKRRWTEGYLEGGVDLDRIRHELYEQVIFPVLLDGYRRNEPWSLWWLAMTGRNFQRSQGLWQQLGHQTPASLLLKLYDLCPDDDRVRLALLDKRIDWLAFAIHEWPGGILYGMDAATLEECEEIKKVVVQAQKLDREGEHTEFLKEFESRLAQWMASLGASSS
jgi:hypothetical protein